MEKIIYLDNAATTRVYPEVLEAMTPFFTEHFANPAAFYSFANPAQKAVHEAREQIANLIGAKNDEIYLPAVAVSLITGQSKQQQKPTRIKESILLPLPLSITQCFIPVSG